MLKRFLLTVALLSVLVVPANSADISSFTNKGLKLFGSGQYNEAIQYFDKAISLNPNDALAYYNRGVVKGYLGQYSEEIQDYDKAISLEPNNADFHELKQMTIEQMNKSL